MVKLVKTFKTLLEAESTSESDVQKFLEKNSELIYTPFLLHHGLLYNSLISKFPLDTALVTDFAYLTKCSDYFVLVFVELEHPQKRIFTNNPKQVTTSAEFNYALSQIQTWKEFLRGNKREVFRRLKPLLKCLPKSPVFIKYLLVIGRRDEIGNHEGRRSRIATLSTDDILVRSYDSLVNAYTYGFETWGMRKNILTLSKSRYCFKYLHVEPLSIFAYLTPEHLELTIEQKRFLIERGYEIDKWEKGRLLKYNGKTVGWGSG